MLCPLSEENLEKSSAYWPATPGAVMETASFKLSCVEVKRDSEVRITQIQLDSKSVDDEEEKAQDEVAKHLASAAGQVARPLRTRGPSGHSEPLEDGEGPQRRQDHRRALLGTSSSPKTCRRAWAGRAPSWLWTGRTSCSHPISPSR